MQHFTKPRHHDGKPDNRYTCALEYCGYSVPMHVVRFCDDMIGCARDTDKASHIALNHQKERFAQMERV